MLTLTEAETEIETDLKNRKYKLYEIELLSVLNLNLSLFFSVLKTFKTSLYSFDEHFLSDNMLL